MARLLDRTGPHPAARGGRPAPTCTPENGHALNTDTNPAIPDETEEEPPARYLVRLIPTEENPGRFHQRKDAEAYARAYGLTEGAVVDSWATGETLPPWLAQAEADLAAERAASDQADEEFALDLAKDINAHLAKVGITPITPAHTDGKGRLIPAFLAAPSTEYEHYGVHASFDEDTGRVYLLAEDYETGAHRTFYGLRISVDYLDTIQDVLRARRNGPKPMPAEAPKPSVDTLMLAGVLGDVHAALETIAKRLDRP